MEPNLIHERLVPPSEPAEFSKPARRVLRALFVLPSLDGGGAERVTVDLLRLLRRDRVRPALFLFRRRGALLSEIAPELLISTGGDAKGTQAFLHPLPRLIVSARAVDVIVACLQCRTTYLAWLAGTVARRPVIGWVQNAAVRGSPMYRLRHRTLMRLLQPRLAASVFPCERAYEALAKRVPFARKRVEFIPNFINHGRVRRLAAVDTNAKLERLNDETVLTAVGRLAPQKGFDVLLHAVSELRVRGHRCRLIMLGEGPERSRLMSLARRLSLQEFVEMPGYVANPYPIMGRSDVFVLASRFEGLPLALMEARALGIPIVSTDCVAGPREILNGSSDGLLVPVNDHMAMADAIESFIENPRSRTSTLTRLPEEPVDGGAQAAVTAWEELLSDVAAGV
jgi:glycosyltransferase involved in cell wall biosynthesis